MGYGNEQGVSTEHVVCFICLQGLLARGQACGAEPISCVIHLLQDDCQVWQAFSIIKLSLQVKNMTDVYCFVLGHLQSLLL